MAEREPRYAGYIFDLDGTIYLGERLIPGAQDTIAWLRRHGRPVVFLSNKPLEPRGAYAAKLSRLGIPASEADVVNSTQALLTYLRAERPGASCGHLFPGQGENPLSDQTVRALVKRLARAAGLTAPVTPHVFRHSIATYLLELGVDIRNIQALLGHSSISVTEIYTKVTPEAQYRVLNEKFPGVGLGGQR